jgi:hypothetical protein
MRRCRKFAALLILILWICLSGAQGQPHPESIHSTGYFLRIDWGTGWTEQAAIPLGAVVPLVIISPISDNGYIYEIHPDGKTSSQNHYFLHRDHLTFCADTIGRHKLYFVIGDKASNSITIDVMGTGPQQSCQQTCIKEFQASRAIDIGEHSRGAHLKIGYISPGHDTSRDPLIIHYDLVGSHVMNTQFKMAPTQSAPRYIFGRDFSLGIINSNYPGTPFLTQFLSDP